MPAALRIAGDWLDAAIVDHLRRRHGVVVEAPSAERLRLTIGSAQPLAQELVMLARGRVETSGEHQRVEINSIELREALAQPLSRIGDAARERLELLPVEVTEELAESGIVLHGGAARLEGLDRMLCGILGVPVRVADDPWTDPRGIAGLAFLGEVGESVDRVG